jgi:hypothetical protein
MRYRDFERTGRKVSEIALTGFERHPRTRVQLVSNKDDLATGTLGPERATDADVAGGDIVDAGGRLKDLADPRPLHPRRRGIPFDQKPSVSR